MDAVLGNTISTISDSGIIVRSFIVSRIYYSSQVVVMYLDYVAEHGLNEGWSVTR